MVFNLMVYIEKTITFFGQLVFIINTIMDEEIRFSSPCTEFSMFNATKLLSLATFLQPVSMGFKMFSTWPFIDFEISVSQHLVLLFPSQMPQCAVRMCQRFSQARAETTCPDS